MMLYPLFLNLRGRRVVIFGAGKVGLRKAKGLLRSGAKVNVASLEFSPEIKTLARKNSALHLISFKKSLNFILKKADLVFLATSDAAWNKKMAQRCRQKGIWVNVADHPRLCDFFVPSRLKKGKLEIAISTGGASPYLAKRLRLELSRRLRPSTLRILDQMKTLRREMRSKIENQKERLRLLKRKLNPDIKFFKES